MLRMYFMDRKEIQESRIGKKQVECELTEKDKTQVRTYDSFTWYPLVPDLYYDIYIVSH